MKKRALPPSTVSKTALPVGKLRERVSYTEHSSETGTKLKEHSDTKHSMHRFI